MKKILSITVCIILVLTLASCSKYPKHDLEGKVWNENWEMLGSVLGVESPGNGFTIQQNASILTGDDTYYATWTTGEPTKWVNEDGDKVDLYKAQIYLMLYGCGDKKAAKEAMEDFTEKEEKAYKVTNRFDKTYSGQDYSLFTYKCGSETNPYSRGISAFGIYENYVINAELTCTDEFDGDETAILTDFLNGCHLAKDF